MAAVTAMAVATVAAGAYSANKASKASDKASKRQQQSMDAQAQVAQDQLDFGKEQYEDWKQLYMPALTSFRELAMEEERPDYGAIAADVGMSFDTAQDINRRTMERYGVNPTDGAFSASETQYGLGRAMAQVNGNNQARKAAKDTRFNKLASFASLSSGAQANALNTMNAGSSALGGAFGGQAAMYGARADQYSQAAAAGAQMMGRGVSSLVNEYSGNNMFGGV